MKGKLYLSYTKGDPWTLTWEADGMGTQRLTFATEPLARKYAADHGIRLGVPLLAAVSMKP